MLSNIHAPRRVAYFITACATAWCAAPGANPVADPGGDQGADQGAYQVADQVTDQVGGAVHGAGGGPILVLGDSLSSGYGLDRDGQSWVAQLRQRLGDEGYGYEVVNASISGDTTSGGLARLPALLEAHSPSIVILELGGNDGLRGQQLSSLRGNLRRMIELTLDSGATPVLAGMQIPPNYGPAYAGEFARTYPELAAQFEIPLVRFLLEDVALNPDLMQPDTIHPNAGGNAVMLDNVWPVLAKLL